MAWLLDTNVLSEGQKPKPDARVTAFYDAQPPNTLYVSIRNSLGVRQQIPNRWLSGKSHLRGREPWSLMERIQVPKDCQVSSGSIAESISRSPSSDTPSGERSPPPIDPSSSGSSDQGLTYSEAKEHAWRLETLTSRYRYSQQAWSRRIIPSRAREEQRRSMLR